MVSVEPWHTYQAKVISLLEFAAVHQAVVRLHIVTMTNTFSFANSMRMWSRFFSKWPEVFIYWSRSKSASLYEFAVVFVTVLTIGGWESLSYFEVCLENILYVASKKKNAESSRISIRSACRSKKHRPISMFATASFFGIHRNADFCLQVWNDNKFAQTVDTPPFCLTY